MGCALSTPSGHIHVYPYWRRAKIVYSRIDGPWRKMMVREDFERTGRDRACGFHPRAVNAFLRGWIGWGS